MTRIQYLLTKLAEECAEVTQDALKTQQFGLYEVKSGQEKSNQQRLAFEVSDLLCVLEILRREGVDLMYLYTPEAIKAKYARIDKYYFMSQELGMVDKELQVWNAEV